MRAANDETARSALVDRVLWAVAHEPEAVDVVSAMLTVACIYIRTADPQYRLERAKEAADLLVANIKHSYD
jgi:rhamnogalacturonyl hydrolase YesR